MSVEVCPALEEMLRRNYGFEDLGPLRRLSGGYENDVFLVEPDGERWVVRVCAPWISPERVSYEHALMDVVGAELPEVPRPGRADDGSSSFVLDERVVSVFPHRSGVPVERSDDELRDAAARLLARIHAVATTRPSLPEAALQPLVRMDWVRNPHWDLPRVRGVVRDLGGSGSESGRAFARGFPEVEEEWTWARRRVGELGGLGLRSGPIHGDFWPGNLLAEDGRITAVLDWVESREEWFAFELGRAVWEFCSDRDEHVLLLGRALAFLDAYREAGGPVSVDDLDLLVEFMRIGVLGDVLYGLTYEDPEEAAEYHLGSLERLRSLRATEALR